MAAAILSCDGQLEDALLRPDARFIVGIQMHTGGMTPDQAGSSSSVKVISRRRSRFGNQTAALRSTYLVYTLANCRFSSCREDYRKMRGKISACWNFTIG